MPREEVVVYRVADFFDWHPPVDPIRLRPFPYGRSLLIIYWIWTGVTAHLVRQGSSLTLSMILFRTSSADGIRSARVISMAWLKLSIAIFSAVTASLTCL